MDVKVVNEGFLYKSMKGFKSYENINQNMLERQALKMQKVSLSSLVLTSNIMVREFEFKN